MLTRANGPRESRRKSQTGTKSPAADPVALDLGELGNALGYVLRRAQLASFKNFKDTFKGTNLTPAQYSVLMVIDRNPGLRQNQISDALGIKRANFVLLLNSLETRGLAQRAPATDRRSYALQLTPSGKRLLKKLRALSAAHEERVTAAIGRDGRETLITLLRKLSTMLETGQ